jgi:hypothetical protein
MLLKPLKRVPIEGSSAEMVEPTAGLATAFVQKLGEFPKDAEDKVSGSVFSGLRSLICLFDNGAPFLPQLVNSLHEQNPAEWPLTLQENVSLRQTLDDIEVSYLTRIIDYFLDALTVGQMEDFNAIIRTQLWVEKNAEKNS